MSPSTPNSAPKPKGICFPQAVLITSRREHASLSLHILTRKDNVSAKAPEPDDPDFFTSDDYWQTGSLPKDLHGHLFVAGPVGSFASKPLNSKNGSKNASSQNEPGPIAPSQNGLNSMLNGDGMIYRLDLQARPNLENDDSNTLLEEPGKAWLSCKIVKTLDYFVDQKLYEDSLQSCREYFDILRFTDLSLSRLSPFLGLRNSLNTAFLPLPCVDGSTRLVATWDAGRPHEINPRSLDLSEPVGWYQDWEFIVSFPQGMSKEVGNEEFLNEWREEILSGQDGEECLELINVLLSDVPSSKSGEGQLKDLLGPTNEVEGFRDDVEATQSRADELEDSPDKMMSDEMMIWSTTVGGPFYTIFTEAHPQFDVNTREFFSVNATKSLRQLLWLERIIQFNLNRWISKNAPSVLRWLLKGLINSFVWVIKRVGDIAERWGLFGTHEVFLMRWQVSGDKNTPQKTKIDKWLLVEEVGVNKKPRPILIRQALHQMGITKDYIIVADVAFKFAFEGFLPTTTQSPILRSLRRAAFSFLTYPQMGFTPLYIVPRKPLESVEPGQSIPVKRVKARFMDLSFKTLLRPGAVINPEISHFLTDYDNPNDRITIHGIHSIATDPAEFVTRYDRHFRDGLSAISKNPILVCFRKLLGKKSVDSQPEQLVKQMTQDLRERAGMIAAPMDADLLGSWTIDAKTCKVVSRAFTDKNETLQKDSKPHNNVKTQNKINQRIWSGAIYAWRGSDQCGDSSPGQFTDIYWLDYGVWPQLATYRAYQLYKKHENRILSRKEMGKVLDEGRPAALVRSHIQRKNGNVSAVEVVDRYEFPLNYFSSTPQFIPRQDQEGPTNGYLICIVMWGDIEDKKCEFWIFDAADLKAGPLYRLWNPELNIGLTIHSTWMAKLGTPPERKDDGKPYDVRKDYSLLVNALEQQVSLKTLENIKKLFDYAYDAYDNETSCKRGNTK